VVQDSAISSEFVPVTVVTGEWALLLGPLLAVVGVLILLARSEQRAKKLLICGWVVAFAALACAAVTLAFLIRASGANGEGWDPGVEAGLVLAAISPAVAILGLARVSLDTPERSDRLPSGTTAASAT
jgi:cytochrome bd-type quinol oxidase subunit 2